MYLIFILNRNDILPTEDVALLQEYEWLYKTTNHSPTSVKNKHKKWNPFLEVRTLFCMCFPESFLPGSTPAKAVRASRCVKRETSPISAISCGPRVAPTPFISITTGYSGSVDASSFIFERSDSTVFEAVFSNATACHINIFVMSFFGNTAIRSEEI